MGLAVVSLVVLAIFGALAGLVLSRVFGRAGARNAKRPGGGSSQQKTSDGEMREEAEALRRTGPVLGAATAAAGVLLALVGAVLSTGVGGHASFTDTVPSTSLGAFLGLMGYFLGARRSGRIAIAVAVLALLFGLSASQGYVPGLPATDHGMPANRP